MSVPGKDLLAQIENEHPKLGIYLRSYLLPSIQKRGLPNHILATPTDKVGNAELTPLSSVVSPGGVTQIVAGTNVTVSPTDGKGVVTVNSTGGGTVTSVDLTAPPEFNVAGVPITTTGTIAITKANESANTVWAGPTSGGATQPSFRTLVAADIPSALLIVPFGITYDGGSTTPGIPSMRSIEIPFNCTIMSWTISADASGSASVDVWFIAGSAPPSAPPIPTVANKISASAPIALSTVQTASGDATAISTWTKPLTQWGVLAFNLTSVTTCKWLSVQIQCTKT